MKAVWALLFSAGLSACASGSANAPSAFSAPAQMVQAARSPVTRASTAATRVSASATLVSSSATRIAPGASVWFHPLPPGAGPPGDNGSADYAELFAPDAPWPHAASRTSVFGIYAGAVVGMNDGQLHAMVDFLNAHGMTIELEAPALQALATCGSGVEGYVPYGTSLPAYTLAYLQRLRRSGAA